MLEIKEVAFGAGPAFIGFDPPVIGGGDGQPVGLFEEVGAPALVRVVHLGGEGDGDSGAVRKGALA